MQKAILKFTYWQEVPIPVHEVLYVFDDGDVWLWSWATADRTRQNQAGTFRVQLDEDALTAVTQLAQTLTTMSPQTGLQQRGAPEVSVRAYSNEASGAHLLSLDQPLAPTLEQAAHLADDLLEKASLSPLSAVKLSLNLQRSGSVSFRFHSLGTADVTFLLDPKAFKVWDLTAVSGEQLLWQNEDKTAKGLVAGLGRYIGGINKTAILLSGETAALSFRNILTQEADGEQRLKGAVAGWLDALFPEGVDVEVNPQMRFYLSSEAEAASLI